MNVKYVIIVMMRFKSLTCMESIHHFLHIHIRYCAIESGLISPSLEPLHSVFGGGVELFC